MQKIACVFSFTESNWVSCQKIVFNLHKSYQECPDTKLENFNLPHAAITPEEVMAIAQNIYDYNPDVISIMDHKPHPVFLLLALKNLYDKKKKPKIIFHLFGDFTLFYLQWEKTLPALKEFNFEILVASDRQKILVDRMFQNNPAVVCPFPVDHKEFHHDANLRKHQRDIWGLSDQDVVFLFTGRLSRQKRIKTLVSVFGEEFANDPHAHLFIYGYQDNIGDPFLGKHDMEGEYFRYFYGFYKTLPLEVQGRIHFMGGVPNAELRQVYQGADVLVNLSVHNDEDYGMSVAEAQFTGLPAVLTDWGGLASFELTHIPAATTYIPVTIGMKSKLMSRSVIKRTLRALFNEPHKHMRKDISEASLHKFGLKKVTGILDEAIKRESSSFNGFTDLFYEISRKSLASPADHLYLTKSYGLNKLYREIYSAYVR